jgi:glycosyltransferase involved in cell wall biosynthesis
MRVLLVESGGVPGGTERVVDALARGLDRRSFRPWVVLSPSRALDGWADDLRRAAVPVERRAEITSRYQWRRAAAWFGLLRRHRDALLHVHHVYSSSDRYVVPLAHLAGVRAVVVTEHVGAAAHSAGQRWLKRWELSRADVPVAVSEGVADILSREYGLARELTEVVPNGVPAPPPVSPEQRSRLRERWSVPAPARVWLTVGRLEEQKGVDVLLEAWAALEEPRPYLVVVGDGSRRAELEAQARALRLTGCVRFAGAAADARALYRAADGFVLASRFEGMPLALLESMAAGLPVVATAVEGTREVAGDGAARLVPPLDPAALAREVTAVEADPAAAAALGARAAARIAARYGEDHMVDAYEGVYRRVLRQTEAVRVRPRPRAGPP